MKDGSDCLIRKACAHYKSLRRFNTHILIENSMYLKAFRDTLQTGCLRFFEHQTDQSLRKVSLYELNCYRIYGKYYTDFTFFYFFFIIIIIFFYSKFTQIYAKEMQ